MSSVLHTSSATCYSLHNSVLHKNIYVLPLHLTLHMYSAGSSTRLSSCSKTLCQDKKSSASNSHGLSRAMQPCFTTCLLPSISVMTQCSCKIQQNCVIAYNAEERAPKTLWCMVLGQYLDAQLIKAAHIYKAKLACKHSCKLEWRCCQFMSLGHVFALFVRFKRVTHSHCRHNFG